MSATNEQTEKVFLLSSDTCASVFKMEYYEILGVEARSQFNFQDVPVPVPGFVLKNKKGEKKFFPASSERYLLYSESQIKKMTGETDPEKALEKANTRAVLEYFHEKIQRTTWHHH
jgi:hypothetical protein